jgi:hypothetical protein
MLPEVEAYYSARDSRKFAIERDRVHREIPAPDWDYTMSPEQVASYFAAVEKRNAALQALDREHKEEQAAAYQALLNSKDPVVRFIAADRQILRDYPRHTETLLKALPMTRLDLEHFGERQGWCDTYEKLLRRAEEAGKLEPYPDLADLAPLVRECTDHFGLNERQVRAILRKHLPDILASAKAREALQVQQSPSTAT